MPNPQRIWSSSQLPTLPTVARELLELVRDPETTIDAVVQVIRSDPATSAKLVKAANGSYFGLRHEVKTVDRAVTLLGTTVSVSMTLSFVLADDSMKGGPIAVHYQNFWRQSLLQAVAAEALASRWKGQDAGELFLTGLLLSLGRLAMLKTIPKEYVRLLDQAQTELAPLRIVELREFGFNHVSIGAKLLENWKLPAVLVGAVNQQGASLSDLSRRAGAPDSQLVLSGAMAAAVGDYFCTSAKGKSLERMQKLWPLLGQSDPDSLRMYLAECEEKTHQAAHLFDVDMTDLGNSTDMMVEANEQLLQMTLREHASNAQSQFQAAALVEEKSRLEEQNRILQSQAVHDSLTQLHNRKYFDESLHRECSRAQREAAPVSVIFADVDRFKSLNDTYGHAFGDFVLKEIAQRFKDAIRASDVLARYGGEEIVILVHQPTEKGVETLANRIRERVAATPFVQGPLQVSVTCSLGAAIVIPGRKDRDVGRRLVEAADQAMYEAKHGGRNRAVITSLISREDRELRQQVNAQRFSRWLVQQKLLDVTDVSRALLECRGEPTRIGDMACDLGYLTELQIQQVLEEQLASDGRFGEIAIELGYLTGNQLIHLLTLQTENPQQLTSIILRMGLLSPEAATSALQKYSREQDKLARQQELVLA